MQSVVRWEVLFNQAEKFPTNVGGIMVAKLWVEPYNLSSISAGLLVVLLIRLVDGVFALTQLPPRILGMLYGRLPRRRTVERRAALCSVVYVF